MKLKRRNEMPQTNKKAITKKYRKWQSHHHENITEMKSKWTRIHPSHLSRNLIMVANMLFNYYYVSILQMKRKWSVGQIKGRTNLATALSNCAAAAVVGVGLSTWLAVVVGSTPLRARDGVPLQRCIAYVLCGRQYAAVDLSVHFKFIFSHALSHGALATGLHRNPAEPLLSGCLNDSQSCQN